MGCALASVKAVKRSNAGKIRFLADLWKVWARRPTGWGAISNYGQGLYWFGICNVPWKGQASTSTARPQLVKVWSPKSQQYWPEKVRPCLLCNSFCWTYTVSSRWNYWDECYELKITKAVIKLMDVWSFAMRNEDPYLSLWVEHSI